MEKIKEPLKLGGILGAIARIIAVMLSFVNHITAGPIEAANKQVIQEGLKKAMPSETELEFVLMEGEIDRDNSYGIEVNNLYIASDGIDAEGNINIVGYLATVLPEGYAGSVETIVGMDSNGVITGVVVTTNMSETPGLGAKAKDGEFAKQFEKAVPPEGGFAVKRDGGEIDAITSATITSRAITNGVNAAVEVINKNNAFEKINKDDIIDDTYTKKAEEPPAEETEENENQEGADGEEADINE